MSSVFCRENANLGGIVELTAEQLETIRAASREIEFGRITVSFTGEPSNTVDIVAEKHIRFQRRKTAGPTTGEPVDRRGSGRL
jgi:hypothetical protein